MKLSACLLFVVAFAFVNAVINIVPVQYITDSAITSNPRETNLFNLRTCGGEQLDHCKGNVHVNFPHKPWNTVVGDYVYVTVFGSAGKEIANNIDTIKKEPVPDFQFIYFKNYSDLLLNVTAGSAPMFSYTLTVTFNNCSRKHGQHFHSEGKRSMYIRSPKENNNWGNIRYNHGNMQDLRTIFDATVVNTVETGQLTAFLLLYCVNPNMMPGYITISVISTDGFSGFATGVCTSENQNCSSFADAKFYDVSGTAFNFVYVPLTRQEQIGPMKVLVIGNGRFNKDNNFILIASPFFTLFQTRK